MAVVRTDTKPVGKVIPYVRPLVRTSAPFAVGSPGVAAIPRQTKTLPPNAAWSVGTLDQKRNVSRTYELAMSYVCTYVRNSYRFTLESPQEERKRAPCDRAGIGPPLRSSGSNACCCNI